jgi:hypothetical protein
MPRHSARRFLLEVLFLAGVAAALAFAELRPAAIIGLMAVAWAVVALLEWTAWLDEPHYGRGLPPRYYVPHVALPPPVAVEQREPDYPVLPLEDEPTFVASTQEWGLGVAGWPELAATAAGEDTVAAPPPGLLDDEGVSVVPLPPQLPEVEETVEVEALIPEEPRETVEAAPAPEVETTPVPATVAQPQRRPPEPAQPERAAAPPPAPRRELGGTLAMPARVVGTALHRVDPLTSSGRRRFGLGRGGEEVPGVEVMDGPPPDRTLPSRVLEESGRR